MTLRTLDQGGPSNVPEYLKRGALGNVLVSIMVRPRTTLLRKTRALTRSVRHQNAFRLGKLSAKSGDIKQLGGEFVMGPVRPLPRPCGTADAHATRRIRETTAPLRTGWRTRRATAQRRSCSLRRVWSSPKAPYSFEGVVAAVRARSYHILPNAYPSLSVSTL